jgi:dTDP-4-amino-4,6-dideoxygalactose transaminase
MEYARHIYHVYALRMRDRAACMQALESAGIGCGIHYPVPIHLQPAYGFMGIPTGSFPVSEQAAGELLSLPMYPELTEEQLGRVAGEVRRFAQAFGKPGAMASNA